MATQSDLADFFYFYEFRDKSSISPNKILNFIPQDLKRYFWRGYFDGDGFISKDKYFASFSGPIDMNWSFLFDLFNELEIKSFSHVKTKRKGSKSKEVIGNSEIKIANRVDVLKLCNYLYLGFCDDKIGLSRKYNRFLNLIDMENRFLAKKPNAILGWVNKRPKKEIYDYS